ncbi:ATP-binding protein [Modestobacter muralis]|uniref:ATP-binding protein n=1 Tax=Modestobacter muralis TaxID=1608614 RepID=A0A6P0EXI4_9ACTN|nr:ATP-binding protein [Modestobacter muralis]NEK95286.1 ATP-binding protein [Modestobacter muralis]NEN52174.1 ATP-binding protein [Modestobacter muralis]
MPDHQHVSHLADRRRAWRLPAIESSLPALRRELGAHLSTSTLSADETYDLVLSVSEAASNAVEHAQDPRAPFFDVTAEVEGRTVTVTVQDRGRWLPPTAAPFRGRGLAMMRLLTDTTVDTDAEGTTVTMRKPSAPPAPERPRLAS